VVDAPAQPGLALQKPPPHNPRKPADVVAGTNVHPMAFFIAPGQFTRRAQFYYQVAQLMGAGITLPAALQQIEQHPPSRSYREPVRRLMAQLAAGSTLAESVRQLGSWLPAFDVALLEAAEQSGRLDNCFRLLASYYEDRARLARQVISDLAYPAFLFHFAIFILPFARFFSTGDWATYLGQTVGILLPIYFLVFVGIYASQASHNEGWRAGMEALFRAVPVLGSARHALALARLSAALEALLSAGVSIVEAWELAATASGSSALRRIVLAWRPLVNAGQTPAEVVSASRWFPQLFATQYTSGEISGKLEETLRRLHRYYQEEGSRKLQALAQWTPRAIYLGVMLMIAYRVISFWSNYFNQIGAAGGF
jgi:type IV pilus assembly protein PilC